RRYGLRQLSVEQEGKEPNARSLARLIDQARELGIRTLIVQPQHSGATAQVVARALNARMVEIDPLAEDYFTMMRRLAEVLLEEAS
ncbi:MAG TPA: ABC transporter substrate-binding protein, partial [Chromatiaceae bacterium]|nr:ABC transporter substrate-binding protein [Chromatiaceae bacterium]